VTDVEVFQFPATGQQIRMVLRDEEPWFIGRDACAVLALAKPENSLALLDEDEKDTHTVGTPGGPQVVTVINESGLYSLILRSRKKEAKTFKRWITHEVLPSIRKTGTYGVARLSPRELAQLVIEEADRADRAEALNTQQAKELESARPQVAYVSKFVRATDDVSTVKAFGAQVGMSEKEIREYLLTCNVIYRKECWRTTSKGNRERVWQWVARPKFRSWFTPKDQPDAPRLHNGQLQQTLYVNAVGKQRIAELLQRKPPALFEAGANR
jgi:prophage antirepressor-like protein